MDDIGNKMNAANGFTAGKNDGRRKNLHKVLTSYW